MQKRLYLKILSLICCGISAILTIQLTLTLADTMFEKIVSGLMGFCLEVGVFVFIRLYKEEKGWIKLFYITLSLLLFHVSIFGSMCYLINRNNVIKNEQLISSEGFRLAKQSEEIAKDNRNINKGLLDTKKTELNNVKSSFESEIASINTASQQKINGLQAQKNSLPRNYLTQKNNIQLKINKEISNTQAKLEEINKKMRESLNSKSSELSTVASKLETNVINDTSLKEITVQKDYEKGYLGFAVMYENWTIKGVDKTVFIIEMILAYLLGLTGLGYFIPIYNKQAKPSSTLLGSKDPSEFTQENTQEFTQAPKQFTIKKKSSKGITNEYTQSENLEPTLMSAPQYGTSEIITTNTSPIHIEPKKIIGFKKEVEEVSSKVEMTDKNVIAFIEMMFETATDNECTGYRKLSRMVGIKEGKGRQIFESLKQNGAIKVINGTTTIIKKKEDIKL